MPRIREKAGRTASVIMPAYNAEPFVGRAIDSVLAQTHTKWELLVVDDGSTDGTHDVVQRYRDPRIVYIHQDNRGVASARNTALDAARGEYVAFLDADDLFLPNALEDLVTFLMEHPDIDVAYSDGFFCDDRGKPLMRLSEHRPGVHQGNILESVVLTSTIICAVNCTLTRRSAIVDHRVNFDTCLTIGEDWDFWIQLARHAQFGYLDKLTCIYSVHTGNATRVSGAITRRRNLVRARLKVMNANWFGAMSLAVRRAFFYDLLIGLLYDDRLQQRDVLVSVPFLALPRSAQATLLRHVAGNRLLAQRDARQAREYLEAALEVWPADRRSRFLATCLDLNVSLCRIVLATWQAVHSIGERVRVLGKRVPRPAPDALTRVAERRENVPVSGAAASGHKGADL